MNNNDKPVFDDWTEVANCNLCEHHWNSSCDGQADKCTSYLPTNKANILNSIAEMQKEIKDLKRSAIITDFIILGILVVMIWL